MKPTFSFNRLKVAVIARRLLVIFLFSYLYSGSVAAEIVIIVNSDSVVSSLTKKEVRRIFLGKMRTFKSGGRIKISNYPDSHNLKQKFYPLVTGVSASKAKSRWAAAVFSGKTRLPEQHKNEKDLIKWISTEVDAIGYVDSSEVTDDVKVVYRQEEQ